MDVEDLSNQESKGEEPQSKGKWGGNRHPKDASPAADWVSKAGLKRCIHFYVHGGRCQKWGLRGTVRCIKHPADGIKELRPSYTFQTEEMQAVFNKFQTDPNRVDVSNELSLIRTCIQGVVSKLKGITDPSQIPMEVMTFLISASKDAADLAERLNRIERGLQLTMNVGQFKQVIEQVALELSNHVTPEVMEEVLDNFDKIRWPTGTLLRENHRHVRTLPDPDSDADNVGPVQSESSD